MSLKHKSIVERLVEELENRILKGQLEPGQKIPEEALCEEWQVSRASLREAFRILESQGFVVREPRRGVRVTVITPEWVREIYQVCASLESTATRLAVERQDPKVIKKLRSLHKRMLNAHAKNDVKGYTRLNQEFHDTIIQGSGNDFLVHMLSPINKMTKRFRCEVLTVPGRIPRSLASHEHIIGLFERNEAEEAESLRKETILKFGDEIISILKERDVKQVGFSLLKQIAVE